MKNTQRVGVCAVIHDGKILALKSNSKKDRNVPEGVDNFYWELPGGKADPGEGTATAAVRETWEEVGVDVEVIEEFSRFRNYVGNKIFGVAVFLCKIKDGEPTDGFQIEGKFEMWRWIGAEEAEHLKWLPSNIGVIKRMIEEGILK